MIRHFIKRDFQDFLLGWMIIGILTVVAAALGLLTSSLELVIFVLGYVYFMFASWPAAQIIGSVWRTQHQMSRYYLLSLPVSHRKLFFIQQMRLAICWIPFIAWASLLPFITRVGVGLTWDRWGLYYSALCITVATIIHVIIWTSLIMERIASYLPRGKRILAYLKLLVVPILGYVTLVFAWMDLILWDGRLTLLNIPLAEVIFFATFVILIFWIPRNARRWCVTLEE